MRNINVIKYTNEYEKVWDDFVMYNSVNGTFLHTRRFLNYHPKSRFKDASILFVCNKNVVAVCPGCDEQGEKGKIFFSHKGSTYGGLVISPLFYKTEKVIELITIFDEYLLKEGFSEVILKITPDILAKENSSLLQYCLYNQGYSLWEELNTYINLDKISEDVISCFDRNKKRNIAKCEKQDLVFRELKNDSEIEDFYHLLEKNLEKYNLKPIHTIEEIKEFKKYRLTEEVKFYGVFQKQVQLAGGMLFVFKQTNTIHAQNLSADYTFNDFSPITYLYYKIIEMAKKQRYSKLSWGISTENNGKKINLSLIRNKESYGSDYALNTTYYKELMRMEDDV